MKVIKIGGGCLKGKKNIGHILELIGKRGRGNIFVVSALNGVTDILIDGMSKALEDEGNIPGIISRLKSKHVLIARHLISADKFYKKFVRDLRD